MVTKTFITPLFILYFHAGSWKSSKEGATVEEQCRVTPKNLSDDIETW